jgi:hypothetical protein
MSSAVRRALSIGFAGATGSVQAATRTSPWE